jgi:hypothetical protein
VAGARAAAGTSCAGATPAISCSGEVESVQGRTAKASAGFIGAGRGHMRGLAWRGARGVGRWACSGAFRPRRTRGGVLLPCSKACRDRKRANLGKNLARASSWHLWLSLVCEFQGEISPR